MTLEKNYQNKYIYISVIMHYISLCVKVAPFSFEVLDNREAEISVIIIIKYGEILK